MAIKVFSPGVEVKDKIKNLLQTFLGLYFGSILQLIGFFFCQEANFYLISSFGMTLPSNQVKWVRSKPQIYAGGVDQKSK